MKSIETNFRKINVKNLNDNFFKVIDDEWMLITAGDTNAFNMMTASWGTTGILWNIPVAICFIRPHRFTFEFAEKSDIYTLSFFDRSYRKVLNLCGSKSGRDTNKVKETGLLPVITEKGGIAYDQARMVIECEKLYADYLKEDNFIIPEIARKNYRTKDFHRFYIGGILNCYIRL